MSANALSRWGMFGAPQGSIVTCCFAHTARSQSMLNWRPPSSPACGAYGNDEPADAPNPLDPEEMLDNFNWVGSRHHY